MPRRKKYCYLTPDYPKEAFILCQFIFSGENVLLHPINPIFTNVDDAMDYMPLIEKEVKKNDEFAFVPEYVALLPIYFDRLILLTPEHWENPLYDVDVWDSMKAFIPVLQKPTLHELLVLPSYYDKKLNEWEFYSSFPFRLNTLEEDIDRFLRQSKEKVSEVAKYAAMYRLGDSQRLNWKTGEIENVKFEASLIN